MLAAMIERDGELATRAFVRGLVANFAREPIDLDIVQINGVAEGVCDIAICNDYYYGLLMDGFGVVTNKAVLDAVGVHHLDQ
jgi:iron(III) transport system substrate-binding protein